MFKIASGRSINQTCMKASGPSSKRYSRSTKHSDQDSFVPTKNTVTPLFNGDYNKVIGATGKGQGGAKGEFKKPPKLPLPKDIRDYLDQYVIGQDRAKKILAVSVYNHYKRTILAEVKNQSEMSSNQKKIVDQQDTRFKQRGAKTDSSKVFFGSSSATASSHVTQIDKSNILMMGPTGSGKTLLAQKLADALDVPMVMVDCTTLTSAGYVGDDVNGIIVRLFAKAGNDAALCQRGIVFLDEVDKIKSATSSQTGVRDIGGEGVQQALLKLVEGTTIPVQDKSNIFTNSSKEVSIDTSNILFIATGAFSGISKVIQRRTTQNYLGFAGSEEEKHRSADFEETFVNQCPIVASDQLLAKVTPADVVKFGFTPEFVGRFPVVCSVTSLTEEMLVRILTEPKNALTKQYQSLLKHDGVTLEFTPTALQALAAQAVDKNTGARGLRAILENLLLDVQFEAPSARDVLSVRIDRKNVDNPTEYPPVLIRGRTTQT